MEIKATNIHKVYGAVTVLADISFTLEQGVKVGLVGGNGTGKSTLLKIIARQVESDGGEVTFRKGLAVGYMPQDTSLATDESISDYLRRVSGIAKLEEEMATKSEAMTEYERRNGYAFYARMEAILAGFGFGNISTDRSVNTLSSGQKSKVFMSGILLSDANVLLLDEPTNNLDLPALIWLESFLKKSTAACIIVSHDRFFLDTIVRRIFEIDWRTRELSVSNGRYSDYLERVQKERVRQLAEFENQQEEITRLTESARSKKQEAQKGAKFKGTDNDKFLRGFKRDRASGSAKAAKAIEKRIEQIDRVEKPIDRTQFRILLKAEKPKGSQDITLKEVVAGYPGSSFRIGPVSLAVHYGSRLAILGLNGSGKSTLLATVSGKLTPIEGEISVGSALVVGNLMQEHDNLPRDMSIRAFLGEHGKLAENQIYNMASKFGFKAEEIDKQIGSLSPGGRSRLLFALFTALSVNVLILDEPTNHLDLEALEALEVVVVNYQGTIILVSHDRYFLEKYNPTDTYVLTDDKLERQRGLEDYLEKTEREAKRLVEKL